MFRSILVRRFAGVVPVPHVPPVPELPELDLVFEVDITVAPRIEVTFIGPDMAHVHYSFKLWHPGGELLASWAVHGVARSNGGSAGNHGAIQRAVHDAGNKFVYSVDSVAALRARIEQASTAPSSPR